MNQKYRVRVSTGKIILSTIFAVVLGSLHPYLMTFRLMLPMVLPSLLVVGCSAMLGSAGWIPAVSMMAAAIASSFGGVGSQMTAVTLPMLLLPMGTIAWGLVKKRRFFSQMMAAVVAGLSGALISVMLAAAVFGTDIIQQLMNGYREVFNSVMPTMWEMNRSVMDTAGVAVTYEEFASYYNDMLQILQQYYELYFAANLLAGAVLTAVLAVFWGNWKQARRGEATAESFVGLSGWYLPANTSLGLMLTLVASAILRAVNFSGAVTAWNVVLELTELAFVIQALAAIDRRQKAQGASLGRRRLLVALSVVVCMSGTAGLIDMVLIFSVIGGISAFFGSRGAVRLWIENGKRSDGNNRH
ncbi:MAG: DUF2232 domain-containing protein [Christensenellales bacterium]|nr:DUF2232 domain-containing protein [Christensenellales bacterium]